MNTGINPAATKDSTDLSPIYDANNNIVGYSNTAGGVNGENVSTAINVSNLQKPETPMSIPTPPADTINHSGNVANGNALIDSNNKTLTPPVDTTQPTTDLASQLKDLVGSYSEPLSREDMYNADYAALGIKDKEADRNLKQEALNKAKSKLAAISAKLSGVTAEATAIPIQLQKDSEGRGITTAGLAPISAAALRENALKALPIQAEVLAAQAEVAAAQGDATLSENILQQAQDHLDKVFQIHQTDATNQYNYRTNLIDKAYAYATEAEKTKLADMKAQLSTNHSDLGDARNYAQTLAATALSNGQPEIAAKLTSLPQPDINSKTFTDDLAKYNEQVAALQGQIREKKSSTSTEFKFSQSQQSQLLSGGFTSSDIANLQNDITQNGLSAVLANPSLTVEQQNLIRRTLAGSDSVADLNNSGKETISRDFLLKTADQTSMLNALGKTLDDYDRWWAWDSDASKLERLKKDYEKYVDDTLLPIIDQYRTAGYSDQEILKMMQ